MIASGGHWTIIRPAVIYGVPRDTELLALFRAARFGVVPPLPTNGRTSVIAVEDLARLMLACLANPQSFHRTYEPGDGTPGGWSQVALAEAIGAAVGKKVRLGDRARPAAPRRRLRRQQCASRQGQADAGSSGLLYASRLGRARSAAGGGVGARGGDARRACGYGGMVSGRGSALGPARFPLPAREGLGVGGSLSKRSPSPRPTHPRPLPCREGSFGRPRPLPHRRRIKLSCPLELPLRTGHERARRHFRPGDRADRTPSTRRASPSSDSTKFATDLEWDSLTVMDFRRRDRGRVRYPHHDEHAGRDRDRRPARRCCHDAEGGAMSEAIDTPEAGRPPPNAWRGHQSDLLAKFRPLIAERPGAA